MSARPLTTAFTTAARRAMAEPGGVAVSIGFYLLVVGVLAGLWRVAADAHGGAVAGYSAVALTWYIVFTEAGTVTLNIRLIDDIGTDIASGTVAVELLRPASVLHVRIASELGRMLPRVAFILPIGALLAVVTSAGPVHWGALALAVPSLFLGMTCNVVAQHAFAASAFWIRNAGSAWYLYQKLVFMLGGMLIPLEVFPRWLEAAAAVLPFRSMAYIPGRLASGHLEPWLLVEQAGWLVVLLVGATAVFRAGERRLQVVGG